MLLSNSRSHFEVISSSEVVLRHKLPRQDKCMDSLMSLVVKVNYASLTTGQRDLPFERNISIFL